MSSREESIVTSETEGTRSRWVHAAAAGLLVASAGIGWFAVAPTPEPTTREITVEAQQYEFIPHRLVVNRGDTLVIRFRSLDVTHGFFLEGYGIDAKARAQFPYFWLVDDEGEQQVEQVTVVVDRSGKFRYRCSETCGSMHPFMQGEMVVRPNRLFPASLSATVGLAGALLLVSVRSVRKKDPDTGVTDDGEEV